MSLLAASSALAQTPPDAGTLQQQLERQLPQVMPSEKKPLAPLPAEMKPATGVTITVQVFRFSGNTLLSAEQLVPAVEPYLNRVLDFAGLQQASAAVAEAYRRAGWLVRVYLPRQEIVDGIVTLQVVEAVFGQIRLDGNAPTRLGEAVAPAYITRVQAAGQPVNAAALDRALLLIDDLPGVAISGNLSPGEGQAETDLVLKIADEPIFTGEAGFDNTGSRATSEKRLTVNAFVNSPLKMGDQASANLVHTEGMDYGRLAYSLPVASNGLRLGTNVSGMVYDVVSPEFKALNLDGSSQALGLDLQYPLIRTRTHNLYVSLGYEDKSYENRANGAITSDYRIRNVSLGLTGNLFDKLGGGGANLASLMLTTGNIDLGALDSSENVAIDGGFTKLRYLLSRQQYLSNSLSLYGALSGQFADSNLDSSEKFYLGGSTGVRAYPSSEAGGADGALLNLELRWRAQPNLVLSGFYDWGQISQNHDNTIGSPANPNRYSLKGAGVSIAWTGPKGLNLKGVYAHRLGNNPNPAANGNDQDGSLRKHRVWFTASLPF